MNIYVDNTRHMDITQTLDCLAALSQQTRLQAVRLLVRHAPQGLPAGEIARELGVPHNTMSTHLGALSSAGLIDSVRESRSIIYSVNFASMRELISFLLEDCCQASPEVCAPLMDVAMKNCCEASVSRHK